MPLVTPGETKKLTITIDGPAGAGKTTIARELAKLLHYTYLDTGAMYRAITWKALSLKVDLNDEAALIALAARTEIELVAKEDYSQVFVDGHDVSLEIRAPQVSKGTSAIADVIAIREILVDLQQKLAKQGGVILEGRDTGTVVCPKADRKFYLDASIEERAARRVKELQEKGLNVDYQQTLEDIRVRDERDKTRPVGALKKAADAIVIDTTNMNITEVIKNIISHLQN